MEWQNPQALFFILPICVGWLAIALYSQSRRQRARAAFVAQQMSDRILPRPSAIKFWIKTLLRELAIIMGLIALAGPKYGDQIEQIIPRGSDLYVLIDVSRSMLADDVAPTRLGRAKADVSSLLNRLDGERVGLVAFAGQAVVKCPLTVDYSSFRRSLDELDPNSAPRGGTAIGDAIRKALEVFQANSDRDQAIVLITDGDDQQSYPLEAAAIAAERKVTIFAIGLGDSERGSRIPQKANSGAFVEHEGEQVWSKLDGGLLQDIALKTSGVYIPAGTRSYDIGELYTKFLQGRRGNDSTKESRVRKAERFQVFLAIALFALLIDLCIVPFKKMQEESVGSISRSTRSAKRSMAAQWLIAIACIGTGCSTSLAGDTVAKVRDGLKHYSDQKFEEAAEAFAAANSQLEEMRSPQAFIAAFDEACAFHRKGDFDKARERYLQAGLSQDRSIATSAHFNLGIMSTEKARTLAGDKPEAVAKDKRQEIIDTLKHSIASYRHCLELDPKHVSSRKNIELTRQWIKFYSDRWNELDRMKRRDETNLIQFLDFMIQNQAGLQDSVSNLRANASADSVAELKRLQGELREEVPFLKEKMDKELRPPQDPNSPQTSSTADKELEDGIAMLKSWADEADSRMKDAATQLMPSSLDKASEQQSKAIEELDRIWDAVVNFHTLLPRELTAQKDIAKRLKPNEVNKDENPNETESDPKEVDEQLVVDDKGLAELIKLQEKTLRKSRLLGPKAEAELSQVPDEPEPTAEAAEPTEGAPTKIDTKEIKAGYEKAIELAPKAVEQMELTIEQLKKNNRPGSAEHAEEARRILQEIQDAQPKNPEKDKQQNQDQDQKDNQDQQQKDQQDKNDTNKNESDKNDSDKKDQDKDQKEQDKKDPEKDNKKPEDSSDKDKDKNKKEDKQKDGKSNPNSVSKDRLEEALRKVREREQAKRERDRELRAKVLGRTPVDKDW